MCNDIVGYKIIWFWYHTSCRGNRGVSWRILGYGWTDAIGDYAMAIDFPVTLVYPAARHRGYTHNIIVDIFDRLHQNGPWTKTALTKTAHKFWICPKRPTATSKMASGHGPQIKSNINQREKIKWAVLDQAVGRFGPFRHRAGLFGHGLWVISCLLQFAVSGLISVDSCILLQTTETSCSSG